MARLTQRKCFAIAFVLNLLVLLKIWSSVQSRDDGAETRALKDRPLQDVDRRFVDRAWPLPDWPKYAPERLSKSQRRDRIAWIWAAGETWHMMAAALETFEFHIIHQYNPPPVWDLFWGSAPFNTRMFEQNKSFFDNLKPYQKVSTIPGMFAMARKVRLLTSRDITCILPAYKLPEEQKLFLAHAKSHPEVTWVQKNNKHRGVRIRTLPEINLKNPGVFVQQYLDNPFLVDGRKFDIGLFIGYTSSEPNRMYLYLGDLFLKFCPTNYYPFDPKNLKKYVEADDYILAKDMPSLSDRFFKFGMNNKACLNWYLQTKHGISPGELDQKLITAAAEIASKKEAEISKIARGYNFKDYSHFFQYMRYDFVLDTNFNVWAIEINSGPVGFRDVPLAMVIAEDLLRLTGVSYTLRTDNITAQIPNAEIEVDTESCASKMCQTECNNLECRVCSHCLTAEDRYQLRRAVVEHRMQRSWRRVMPPPFKSPEDAKNWNPHQDNMFLGLSERTRFTALWYHKKCMQDATYCG